MMSKPMHVGALVYRVSSGRPEFLLITSRNSGRWIIPKGRWEHGEAPHDAVAREAYEEAGIRGVVSRKRIGRYRDRPPSGRQATVLVYPVRATHQTSSWPEKGQRQQKWASLKKASQDVSRPLGKLIDALAAELRGRLLS
jgi:8-oxo-dGTP pyrophosphatase MutT (NUDIX family)